MTRNEAKKSCQSRCVHSWQTRKATVIPGFQCENRFNGMNIWHRRASTHNSELTPFCLHLSLATPTRTFLRILCSCVFESPQHAAAITWRHRLVATSKSKKSTSTFFPQEKIYKGTPVSRRHCLPIKDTSSLYISCVSMLLLLEVYLMRKKSSFTELQLLLSCTKTVSFSKSIICDDSQQVHSTYCGLHMDYIYVF